MFNGTLSVAHSIHIQIHTVSWWVYIAFLSTLYWCSLHSPFAILWTRPLKDISDVNILINDYHKRRWRG
jgi:hypothetical protein